MVRLQVRLTEYQVTALRRLAASQNVSVAALIRQTVDDQLLVAGVDRDERRRRALAIAGRFHSGLPDLSVAHDDYLAQAYQR